MELTGQTRIAASQENVWAALNDPDILKQCVDGCQKLDRLEGNRFDGTVVAKVGPVKATFNGMVTLTDMNPPHGYTLVGEGKGGVAGFAKGQAVVKLTAVDGGTDLYYVATAAVGGKLQQLGARLVEAAARDYAQKFFEKFSALVTATPAATAGQQDMIPPPVAEPVAERPGLPIWIWGGALIIACAAVIYGLARP